MSTLSLKVWPRRQKEQWAPVGSIPMERVERTNTVVVRNPLQEQERIRRKNKEESLCNGCGQ